MVTIGGLAQVSFVVPSLDAAIERWLGTRTTGPFLVMRHLTDLPVVYRGQPAPFDISVAFAQVGPVHVELVEQHDDRPSVFQEVYPAGSPGGLHHLCYLVEELDSARDGYVERGCPVAMDLTYNGTPMVYLDTRPAIGAMTELIRADDGIRALYAQIAEVAQDWDGSDPVREL